MTPGTGVPFGLGLATEIESLVVRWPGGEAEEFSGQKADGFFHLVQGSGVAEQVAEHWGSVNYEVTCSIGRRVPRIVV